MLRMSDENNRLMAARPVYLVDADSGAIVANDAPLPVQLSGSNGEQDVRGLAADKPAASAANKGWTYWSIDTGAIEVSTGSTWKPV